MRAITQSALELIKRFESFGPKPYLCPAGWWTIGYGHVIPSPQAYPHGITEAEAERLLLQDVRKAQAAVLRYITVPLTDGQYGALVSFTFNLGAGALQRSTLRKVVNREWHDDVPAELLRWTKAGGRTLKGLVRRREAEGLMYEKQ